MVKPTYEMLEKRIAALEAENTRLAKIESDLQRSLNFTESLLAALPTPVFYKDAAGRYLGCNGAFGEFMGITAEELRGKTVQELWPSEHAELYHQMDLELMRNPRLQVYEYKVKDKNDRIRPVIFYKNVFRDENDAVVGLVGGFADLSEIRQAANEIHQRQQFLESVLYHAPDAIITMDKQHCVIDWNPGAVKMFGYSAEEAVGHQLDDLVARHQHHLEASRKTDRVLSGKRIEAFETIRYRKDGSPLHVIAAGSPIVVDGELRGVVAVYTDITARVQSEEALKVSHHRFLTVLESIDATIYVADINTQEVLFMNNRMIETFGGNFVGEKCWKVFRGESAPCSVCTNSRLIDESGKATGVFAWQTRNPLTGRWYMNYDQAIEWIDGRIARLQIAMDITEKKKMEDALLRAQKMEAVGTLASGIAHDFNNILMGIQGHASLIAVDLDSSHPLAGHASAINKYVKSAASLTGQLLGLVRGGKYEVKPVNISALLKSSSAMFGRTHKEIQVRMGKIGIPLVAEVDRQQIEQVFLNIFVNALQAMPGGGELFLDAQKVDIDEGVSQPYQVAPGKYVKISITDTGTGIDEAIREKIFDPFFTTKEKSRGTGLGLASAYGIIKNHGGTVTVYSEVGRGTTFNIFLPLSEREVEADAERTESLSGGDETVLLVDDEEMILEVGKALLERLGYRVIWAAGGQDAIEEVRKNASVIDVVILDLVMPGIDGGATFDQIRHIAPTLPVILSSGYSVNGQAAEILDRGCNGFIQKPFDIKELSQKIRVVLESPANNGHIDS
ncbi:MAG: PAS domain S-box protein [Desulfopila sp.]|jgi:PAS domain S-box-containing protein|nr:PAS domain S-box protein [Desulfopila sp.]